MQNAPRRGPSTRTPRASQLGFQRPSPLHRVQRDIDAAPLERRQNPREMPLGAADIEARCDDGDARRSKHANRSGQHPALLHEMNDAIGQIVGAVAVRIEGQFWIAWWLIGRIQPGEVL